MKKLKILFVTTEALPFVRTSNMADFTYNLTRKLKELNTDVRLVMPLFKSIKTDYNSSLRFVKSFVVDLGYKVHTATILSLDVEGVLFYFVDSDVYFDRPRIYGERDDAERFIFFNKAVNLMMKEIDFKPDIIDVNNYASSLIPACIKTKRQVDSFYHGIKTVLSIHNIRNQGIYPAKDMDSIASLPLELMEDREYKYFKAVNFLKAGIDSADYITLPAPSLKEEIVSPYYGSNLDKLLIANSFKVAGILDGIDHRRYDPEKDPAIFQNFSADTLADRAINKQGVMSYYSLSGFERPLISVIGRLITRKGVDFVYENIDYMVEAGFNIIIMGTGEPAYEDKLLEKEQEYPQNVSVKLYVNEKEAIRVMAGSDFFLMPSRTEIQALNHLIAQRYGAIPIVRDTGTLRDGVREYNKFTKKGDGIVFQNMKQSDFLAAIDEAKRLYEEDPETLEIMRRNALMKDSSWEKTAEKYLRLFEEISE